jgi:prefoldin subunit 5
MRSVQELEALVNERLRVELEQVQDERDRLYERISHCMELRNNMTMLQDQKRSSLKTMVDLGCNFYVQARMCAAVRPTPSGASRVGPPSLSGSCQVCAQT